MTPRITRRSAALVVIGGLVASTMVLAPPSGAQEPPEPGGCLENLATLDLAASGGYGIAIDPLDGTTYVALDGSGEVAVIDPSTNQVINTITVPNATVGFLAVDPDHDQLYAGSFSDDAVWAIDLATETVVATIPVTDSQQLALNRTTGTLYAAGQSNDVVVIDTATNAATGTLTVGGSSLGLDVDPATNRIFVGDFANATLDVFDGSDNSLVDSWPLSGTEPLTVAFDSESTNVWVTTRNPGNVAEVDPDDGSTGVSFALAGAQGLAINPSVGQGYVTQPGSDSLLVFALADGAEIDTFAVGQNPLVAAATVDPVKIYVSGYDDGSLTIIGDVPPCPTGATTTTTTSAPTTTTTVAAAATVTPRFTG